MFSLTGWPNPRRYRLVTCVDEEIYLYVGLGSRLRHTPYTIISPGCKDVSDVGLIALANGNPLMESVTVQWDRGAEGTRLSLSDRYVDRYGGDGVLWFRIWSSRQ